MVTLELSRLPTVRGRDIMAFSKPKHESRVLEERSGCSKKEEKATRWKLPFTLHPYVSVSGKRNMLKEFYVVKE
ncbi:hypothetical protein TNCV_2039371 [Trichonephila clavipes]|nr:hypothetical protein TNCV_2039371 [Trichonephila clavipes]